MSYPQLSVFATYELYSTWYVDDLCEEVGISIEAVDTSTFQVKGNTLFFKTMDGKVWPKEIAWGEGFTPNITDAEDRDDPLDDPRRVSFTTD